MIGDNKPESGHVVDMRLDLGCILSADPKLSEGRGRQGLNNSASLLNVAALMFDSASACECELPLPFYLAFQMPLVEKAKVA